MKKLLVIVNYWYALIRFIRGTLVHKLQKLYFYFVGRLRDWWWSLFNCIWWLSTVDMVRSRKLSSIVYKMEARYSVPCIWSSCSTTAIGLRSGEPPLLPHRKTWLTVENLCVYVSCVFVISTHRRCVGNVVKCWRRQSGILFERRSHRKTFPG